jgi:hypothetical protein
VSTGSSSHLFCTRTEHFKRENHEETPVSGRRSPNPRTDTPFPPPKITKLSEAQRVQSQKKAAN